MTMIAKNDLLKRVRIATPCPAAWEQMDGDERVRFCGSCRQNVYNLSEMSRNEALALVRGVEEGERHCFRFFQRKDGTMMTRDCPVGVRLLRRRLAYTVSCGVILIAHALGGLMGSRRSGSVTEELAAVRTDPRPWRATLPEPIRDTLDRLDPTSQPDNRAIAGEPMILPEHRRPLVGQVRLAPSPESPRHRVGDAGRIDR